MQINALILAIAFLGLHKTCDGGVTFHQKMLIAGTIQCRADQASCAPTTGMCVNLKQDWMCNCFDGYENPDGDTKSCDRVDKCTTGEAVECVNTDGTCVNLEDGWRCDCPSGFKNPDGDTQSCERELVDECSTPQAEQCVNGTCVDLDDGWKCDCIGGYKNPDGNITTCENIYQLFTETLSWSDAHSRCVDKGGVLATIFTLEEKAAADEAILNSVGETTDKVRFGLNQTSDRYRYRWVTGEILEVDPATGRPVASSSHLEEFFQDPTQWDQNAHDADNCFFMTKNDEGVTGYRVTAGDAGIFGWRDWVCTSQPTFKYYLCRIE